MSEEFPANQQPGNEQPSIPLQEFTALGMNEIAYIKPMETRSGRVFGIFHADGTQMSIARSRDIAMATVFQQDLMPLDAH